MTCKDCYHYDVCHIRINSIDFLPVIKGKVSMSSIMYKECDDVEKHCLHFKDKSRIIELPCKVGSFVYADTRLFCTDCLREEVRKLDYICCEVVNVRYDKNMKALIYLRPLYRRDSDSRYHIFVPSSAIGTTVFLTVQETQEKLKELEK